MKTFITFFTVISLFLMSVTPAWAQGQQEEVFYGKPVGEEVLLPDGSSFRYFDLEEKVKLSGITLPLRIGVHCNEEGCTIMLPTSDSVEVSKTRVTVAVVVVAVLVLRFVIKPSWLVRKSGNPSNPAAVIVNGGGGGPPLPPLGGF